MIESREQRKKSSLLRRRKIIILVSVFLAIALGIALYFVNSYVNNVIPYVDAADGTTYYIKMVNGSWAMYDKSGNLLPTEEAFGYYVTESGTLVEVRPDTGEYFTRAVPDISDGELTEYEKVLIFRHIESKEIRSIEVHNQVDDFTFCRYNIEEKKLDDKSDLVLRSSPYLTIKQEMLSALRVSAGYALATTRVDNAKMIDGKLDLAEYGLSPEKRTKTELDKDGKEITVEYDYTPSYYILTTTSGEQFKMLIGDSLISGGGYYAQYVEMKNGVETPRNKLYVLSTSIGASLLAEAKVFITPGIAYPVTQSDYYDVKDFTINKKVDGNMQKVVSFSYIDIADRTGTVQGNHPYVFTDERSLSYHPNYNRIDKCLLSFMEPTIIDIAVLAPTNAERAKYGLMKEVLDEEGNPVLSENGLPTYVYDAPYVVSFKRTAKDDAGNTIDFIQTIYISEKNERGNYYSYTRLTFPNPTENTAFATKLTEKIFDMICEVSADTFNFLTYDEYAWTYPFFLETGIRYLTSVTIEKSDYYANFEVTNTDDGENNATSVIAASSTGKTADTFGMLKFTDAKGNKWYINETDFKVQLPNGEDGSHVGAKRDTNDIGQNVKYIVATDKTPDYITVNDGVIARVYIKLNEIKIDYVNGTSKTYVRYQTMLFKKLLQDINTLAIVDDYYLSEEDEASLINDPTKHLATITLSNNEGTTLKVDFYALTSRKAYIIVNGEGGYYVTMSALQKIFEDSEKFFNCENIIN